MKSDSWKIFGVISLISLLYLLLPTNNSTLDAYGYAAQVRYGENLFLSHHLLHNAFFYVLFNFLKTFFPNADALQVGKILNSIFVGFILLFSSQILKILKFDTKRTIFSIIFLGFSFNFLRFGTENEVYILPLLCSVLGSLFFLKFLQNKVLLDIFISGFFAAVACLFHQVQFFWWFSIFIGLIFFQKNVKASFIYFSSALLVPAVYIFVIVYSRNEVLNFNSFIHFVFFDFYNGSAKSEFSKFNFILTGISLIRSFFQIHPNIPQLIKHNYIFIMPIFFLTTFIGLFIRYLFKKDIALKRKETNSVFLYTHFIIFVLQFLFAFYAVGNVEFMVMLPFLVMVTFLYKYEINKTIFGFFTLVMMVWNFLYGIFPNYYFRFTNEEQFVDFMLKHPDKVYIVEDNIAINQFYYKTGIDEAPNLVKLDQFRTENELRSFLKEKKAFTNLITKPKIYGRATMLNENFESIELEKMKLKTVFQYDSFYGPVSIDEIGVK